MTVRTVDRRRLVRLARLAVLLFGAGAALESRADPEYDYLLHCAGCHLPDGAGAPPLVPDLRADLGQLAALPDGRAYLVRVPGSAQAPISDAALAALLTWMVERFTGVPTAPFAADVVGRQRAAPLADPLRFRAALLEATGTGSQGP